MILTSSRPRVRYPQFSRPSQPRTNRTNPFNSSKSQEPVLHRVGRGFGGAIAGAAFSALLLSLPLSLAPALGVEVSSAVNVYKAAVLTCGIGGGLASATLPPDKNWY